MCVSSCLCFYVCLSSVCVLLGFLCAFSYMCICLSVPVYVRISVCAYIYVCVFACVCSSSHLVYSSCMYHHVNNIRNICDICFQFWLPRLQVLWLGFSRVLSYSPPPALLSASFPTVPSLFRSHSSLPFSLLSSPPSSSSPLSLSSSPVPPGL